LWPYCKNLKLYRCPTGKKDEMLHYSIFDGMNGFTSARSGNVKATGVWIKKISEISKPPPTQRMVFIDEGFITADSFAVHYATEAWFDFPPSRHGGGVALGYADGHSSYTKWKGAWTVAFGKANEYIGTYMNPTRPGSPIDITPEDDMDGPYKNVKATCDDYDDLYFIQKGCWGGLDKNYNATSGCPY